MDDATIGNDSKEVYCVCRSSVSNVFMILCDNCEEWFHGDCVGITEALSREIDFYCCSKCKKSNPKLKTTYKMYDCMNKHSNNVEVPKSKKIKLECSYSNDSVNCLEHKLERTVNSFTFVDTTIRKSKTEAYEKLKLSNLINLSDEVTKPKKKKRKPSGYCGAEFTNTDCTGSKYCRDKFGVAMSTNSILHQQIRQYTSSPSTSDERSHQKLIEIRTNLQKIKNDIAAVDIQIVELIDQIIDAKRPENIFAVIHSDVATPVECILCGVEVQDKTLEKHMEVCYGRHEQKILLPEYTKQPDDIHWNVFCNQKISENVYCKKLRVLCPQHYKGRRKADEVCGYPLCTTGDTRVHCGDIGRTCNHTNWEEMQRAELDLKKFNFLLKYNTLKSQEIEIRKQMSSRDELFSLIRNRTIDSTLKVLKN